MLFLKKLYKWVGSQVHTKFANPILAFLFFIEAIFFVPVDPILVLFCIEKRNKAFHYAAIATLFSVLGGICGYFIGFAVWETIGQKLINLFVSESTFLNIQDKYHQYESWAVLIAGFTPIPYKAVTLTAGFFKLPLLPFIWFSAIARGARFFLIASVIKIWGGQIQHFIDRYFNLLVALFLLMIIAFTLVLK
ncbi:MAG: hypothetical protein UR26_C0004G0028 [candidate division TM6 bacterium GW2011_GWF2_32_72]|nr:MAG: hypothetical protein UR26_C0004G0028 [candidate division TM6 bacterium GW2011_GWF2_32_72]